MLRTVGTVIVDEIHAMVDDKRGSHLALSLERLGAISPPQPPLRIGLSATQRPIEAVARFLVDRRPRAGDDRRSPAIAAASTSPSRCRPRRSKR